MHYWGWARSLIVTAFPLYDAVQLTMCQNVSNVIQFLWCWLCWLTFEPNSSTVKGTRIFLLRSQVFMRSNRQKGINWCFDTMNSFIEIQQKNIISNGLLETQIGLNSHSNTHWTWTLTVSPFSSQVMVGIGFPVALHSREIWLLYTTLLSLGTRRIRAGAGNIHKPHADTVYRDINTHTVDVQYIHDMETINLFILFILDLLPHCSSLSTSSQVWTKCPCVLYLYPHFLYRGHIKSS